MRLLRSGADGAEATRPRIAPPLAVVGVDSLAVRGVAKSGEAGAVGDADAREGGDDGVNAVDRDEARLPWTHPAKAKADSTSMPWIDFRRIVCWLGTDS